MNEKELIAEVERRLKGHKDDLAEGTRVVVNFDEVIPKGTYGVVASNYTVSGRESLRVRLESYRPGSVWYLNRWQVEPVP